MQDTGAFQVLHVELGAKSPSRVFCGLGLSLEKEDKEQKHSSADDMSEESVVFTLRP